MKKLSERYKLQNLILKELPYYLQEIKFAVNSLLTKKMSGLGFTGNCYQTIKEEIISTLPIISRICERTSKISQGILWEQNYPDTK